jgi:hypothetical protein
MTIRKSARLEGDPLDLKGRLYKQLGKLLDDMERADRDELMTMPQRIQALIALGRVQKMFLDLRKGELSAGGGSAVERYSAAFATPHAIGGRNERSGPANIVQFDRTEPDDDDREDEFDA